MESMPRYKPVMRWSQFTGLGLLSLALAACSYSSIDPTVTVIPGRTIIMDPPASNPAPTGTQAVPAVANSDQGGSVLETPDQYGQFPMTQQATGPYKVLARNPYLNETGAVTEVPLVANEAGSAVYPVEEGIISHYSYNYAKKLASGQKYCDDSLTAAHKKLPFGTIVRCTRVDNGKSVIVVINDRGPYIRGRVLDLSEEAAQRIGLDKCGITRAKVEVLAYPLIETTGPRGNG